MGWIVVAIVVIGLIIEEAIRQSSAANNINKVNIEQAKLDQERELQQQKLQLELENSPLYQKRLNASLEYVDYLDEYTRHYRDELRAERTLLSNPNLTSQLQKQLKTTIKSESEYKSKLQHNYWQKWDKLERSVDPRHNLLSTDEAVSSRLAFRKVLADIEGDTLYSQVLELRKNKQETQKK